VADATGEAEACWAEGLDLCLRGFCWIRSPGVADPVDSSGDSWWEPISASRVDRKLSVAAVGGAAATGAAEVGEPDGVTFAGFRVAPERDGVAGVVAAIAAARALAHQVSGLGTIDPIAMIAAVALLCASALLACWLPARRASKVDPMVALRHE